MASLSIEFDNDESYHTGPPQVHLGSDFGYASLKGYRIDEGGFVVMEFDNHTIRKVPVRRLLRITEL